LPSLDDDEGADIKTRFELDLQRFIADKPLRRLPGTAHASSTASKRTIAFIAHLSASSYVT